MTGCYYFVAAVSLRRVPKYVIRSRLSFRLLSTGPTCKSSVTNLSFNQLGSNSEIIPVKTPQDNVKLLEKKAADNRDADNSVLEQRGSLTALSLLEGIRQQMDRFQNHVMLTQVGSFYELYYEQAEEYAPQLNLRLARRRINSKHTDAQTIPMAGFPVTQLDRYLKILVKDLKKSVAISDQFERNQAKSLLQDDVENVQSATPTGRSSMRFDRRVARIITPGTLIDESFLDTSHSNFLLAVVFVNNQLNKPADPDSPVALAWIDLSVGSFYVQTTPLHDLPASIARINPQEILLDSKIKSYSLPDGQWYPPLMDLRRFYINYQLFPPREDFDKYTSLLSEMDAAVKFKAQNSLNDREVVSVSAVLGYVEEHLPESSVRIQFPERQLASSYMRMDNRSLDALEVFESDRGNGVKGSLFTSIRRTVTESGTRMLNDWLSSPLLRLSDINARLDLVEEFSLNPVLRHDIIDMLRQVGDCTRIVQKFSLGRGTFPDLMTLSKSLSVMSQIDKRLLKSRGASEGPVWNLVKSLKVPKNLMVSISSCIEEISEQEENKFPSIEGLQLNTTDSEASAISWICVVRPTASEQLKKLHQQVAEVDEKTEQLRSRLVEHLDIKRTKLQLKWSSSLGFILHISAKIPTKQLPGEIIAQNKSTTSIRLPEWETLGTRRGNLMMMIRTEENDIFSRLRKKVLKEGPNIRACSEIMDQLDIVSSFASLAQEKRLVRPILSEGTETKIIKGRHIVVEQSLRQRGIDFVANDCYIGGENANNIWMITGPNMGGKSTFLRQAALISILAQIGCYVPADSAFLGLVDQIFCRVGAADDLYRDQSTFMVEMLETSTILNNATHRSLAIVDEVGRGTSGKDGLAIAYATISHLKSVNHCRTFFATHFGPELYNLLNHNDNLNGIEFRCSDIMDPEINAPSEHPSPIFGRFIFSHKLRPGISTNSHGLRIASLAGKF